MMGGVIHKRQGANSYLIVNQEKRQTAKSNILCKLGLALKMYF